MLKCEDQFQALLSQNFTNFVGVHFSAKEVGSFQYCKRTVDSLQYLSRQFNLHFLIEQVISRQKYYVFFWCITIL